MRFGTIITVIETGNIVSTDESGSDETKLSGICRLQVSQLHWQIRIRPQLINHIFCRFQHLRLLDFRKIKRNERLEAIEFFKSKPGKEILKEVSKKAKLNSNVNATAGDTPAAKGNLLAFGIFGNFFFSHTIQFS